MSTVGTEEMEKLTKQFSELGAQVVFQMCMKFIDDIKSEYPNVPKDEFVKIALKTFHEANIQIDAKIPALKQKVKDDERCIKKLETGANKGDRCKFRKTGGTEYCTKHRNRLMNKNLVSKNSS